MIVNVQPRNGAGTRITDAFTVEIVLSDGKVITLRELQQFPGMLNVSTDGTIAVNPRSSNAVNIHEL